MHKFLLIVWIASMLPISCLMGQGEKRPNVILILADDLGINGLHAYGNEYVESPNIDRLCEEGLRFTNGYSCDPTCAPSRASIMSGQYVTRHRVYRVADRYKKDPVTLKHMKYLPPETNTETGCGKGMSPEEITIAEALKQNGYTTAAFGKWHLGRKCMRMENQGFDEAMEITGHFGFTVHSDENTTYPDSLYSSDFITQKGINFMERSVKMGQPFFLYLPYYLVHKPLEPKEDDFRYFKEKYQGIEDLPEEDLKVLAMIKALDESVGKVVQAVENLGIERETIIIFTSDNGHYKTEGKIFNKPYRGFKGETLEGGIRVPYVFRWPGVIAQNRIVTEPAIHVDLYPTILGMTGTPIPVGQVLDGKDLSPVLRGKVDALERESLVWVYTNYARYNERHHQFASSWVNVIQMDGFKLTEHVESGDYSLYNLNEDPYESNEVGANHPEKLKELQKHLSIWKENTGYEAPRTNPNYIK